MRLDKIAVATVAALTLAAAPAQAQDETRPIRFGLLVGMSMSEFTDLGIAEVVVEDGLTLSKKKRNSFQFGGFVNFAVNDMFSLQPEVHYVRRGMGFEISQSLDPELPSGAEFSIHTSYFEVPVLARIDLMGAESSVRPFVVAGPYFAFRGSCELGIKADDVSLTVACDEDVETGGDSSEDPIKKFDYGASIGGGLGFRFAGFPMSVQARYTRGLAPVMSQTTEGTDPKNQAISVLFGFSF